MPPASGPNLELRPTEETYQAFQQAFDHFNWTLFETLLPGCLITFQRKSRSLGYFSGGRFIRGDETRCDEIAMNPVYFRERSTAETLSTLVHEMVHLWQHHYGTPGRGRYHNRQWAEKMKSLGLQPTDTGKPGGRELGDQMTHLIVDGGPFAEQADLLIATGFAITWQEAVLDDQGQDGDGDNPVSGSSTGAPLSPTARRRKSGVRVRYSCPACGLNAWAKHEALLICGEDHLPLTPSG